MSTSFDPALDYLISWLEEIFPKSDDDIKALIVDVKLLKTFVLYAREAKSNNNNNNSSFYLGHENEGGNKREMLECILFKIEDFVSRLTKDIDSVYISSGKDKDKDGASDDSACLSSGDAGASDEDGVSGKDKDGASDEDRASGDSGCLSSGKDKDGASDDSACLSSGGASDDSAYLSSGDAGASDEDGVSGKDMDGASDEDRASGDSACLSSGDAGASDQDDILGVRLPNRFGKDEDGQSDDDDASGDSAYISSGEDEDGASPGKDEDGASGDSDCLSSSDAGTSDEDGESGDSAYISSSRDGVLIQINRCRKDIKRFGTDIKQLIISLLDDLYSLGGHHQRLVTLFHSLSKPLIDMHRIPLKINGIWPDEIADLREKLVWSGNLIQNLINFATIQGVDQVQLVDLLIHVEVLAVNAACLIHRIWLDSGKNAEKRNKNKFVQTCQLLQKIKPVNADLQLREAYIHVLAVSKLSTPSTHIFSPEKNNGLMVATKFMDSLLGYLVELQQSYTSLFFSIHDGMQKLHEGVEFLCILVRKQHEKFTALDDELKDRIGVVVIDAGILICSISLNEFKEGLTKELDVTLSHLLQVLRFIMAEVEHIYSPPTSSAFGFPATNELGSFDFLLENLKDLASCDCEANSIALLKDQILIVQEGLQSLRSFLENIAGQRNQNIELQSLWNRVMEVAHKAEFMIDSVVVGDKPGCSPLLLDTITKEIKFLEAEAQIYDSVSHDNTQALHRVIETPPIHMPSQISPSSLNEVLVGFDEDVRTIIDELTRGSKQLDIVSIVGMPGIGKTTLANVVYNHASVMYHFHIRAWCTVSQAYSKHGLLLQLLGDTVSENSSKNSNEHDLALLLYKRLKGNRYLIILDDVWDIEALNLLKESFPNDGNASRILFTSRRHDLGSLFKAGSKLHYLRLLTDAESWKLLQNKIFGKGCCPPTLIAVGMQIAKACQGLPLTVVVVAGVLANTDQSCWKEVANSLNSSTIIGTEHFMKTLELSYQCLPDYLKSCLLYFGAFSEDENIRVQMLLWLWICEGFVQNNKMKSLEEVANEYLIDLIDRSLVMVIQQKSTGGAKTCRVHDLLHEFCVAKAKEENFLHVLHEYDQLFTSNRPYNPHRLCIYSKIGEEAENPRVFYPHLRSLHFFLDEYTFEMRSKYSFIFRMFKLLRVLNISDIDPIFFPEEVELLVHLRYLAISCLSSFIPSGIASLSKLEIFVIERGVSRVILPDTIWNMKELRHLRSMEGFIFPTDDLEGSPDLYHLETCTLCIDDSSSKSLEKIIKKFPSIRRLKILPRMGVHVERLILRGYLDKLESLHVSKIDSSKICFPLNLKKLTLSDNIETWSKISAIRKLHNLEALKLLSFEGEIWKMKEEEFPRLRFLKLEDLDLCRWIASCDNFPCLEKLVLHNCHDLKGVPFSLGDIPTLQMIEVRSCSKSAVKSVERIQEAQKDMGNEHLKIFIRKD